MDDMGTLTKLPQGVVIFVFRRVLFGGLVCQSCDELRGRKWMAHLPNCHGFRYPAESSSLGGSQPSGSLAFQPFSWLSGWVSVFNPLTVHRFDASRGGSEAQFGLV